MAARPRFPSPAQAIRAATAVQRAVNAARPATLAARLGVKVTTVMAWTFCPAEHVDAVADASGVARHDLRPDLYPRPTPARALSAEQAVAAHLMAGEHFARTGRCLSLEGR
ncbi:YdaS family helix-turn-helix protein [Methylobacterium sp. SD21]|uniref:YdaS family helix-turn-helix protein n=1 Tax=Methylobacterium litchii TaxID=3138810 RepID=UPI00313EC858